jgi:tetratricopeptide (TPR) repeat protein
VLDTTLRSFAESQKPRTSLKKAYDDLIIPDLEFAVNSKLADTYANGQMSKNAARAILADVYLTCAGYPYQEVATAPDKAWCTTGGWSQQTYPVVSASAASFLAKAKTALADYTKALPLFERSLKIHEKNLGSQHPFTTVILNDLAVVYEGIGNFPQADYFYNKSQIQILVYYFVQCIRILDLFLI